MDKKKIILRLLVCLLLIPICSAASYTDISVEEAHEMLAENHDAIILLDVRTEGEYNAEYIPGSIHIQKSELGGRLDELDKSKLIIVYCKSGGRSVSASNTLVQHGFKPVYNMRGGINVWKRKFATSVSASPPEVVTNNTTKIGATCAILNGVLDSTGHLNCKVWFEYGTTTSYGNSTPKESLSTTGAFNASISSLDDNITHHLRAVASNSMGVDYGSDIILTISYLGIHNLNTSEDFATIQAAIDALNTTDGHTIMVDPGTYTENVKVYKQLTIESTSGNPWDTVVQAANSDNHVFEVTADYVNISGFMVIDATEWPKAGISLGKNADHCNISHNNATGNSAGIYLYQSSNNHLMKNTITSNNHYGIYLAESSNNTIYNNYFNDTNNAYDDGNNTWHIAKTDGTNIIGGSWLGGNYWSDYTGEDSDGDGLGNTQLPYNSSGDIQNGGDWLPLVKPSAP